MKCQICRGPAVIDLRRHNARFCRDHFLRLCRDQVAKAIKEFSMVEPGERVLVAVSGGKDSLALWDLLVDLGYDADGLYLGLGIEGYSDESAERARAFATKIDRPLIEIDLPSDLGYTIPEGSAAARRAPCSACGISKRHLFDQAAIDGGYDVIVTGHNLDDEAAVLFGNVLVWQTDYLGRQWPVLAARPGFPRKAKPLVRLYEREMAAYCILRGIDYQIEECPMSAGNRHTAYKDALNDIEVQSPGSKFAFYFGFLARGAERFRPEAEAGRDALLPCVSCGAPTPTEICAFCRLVERAGGRLPIPADHGNPNGDHGEPSTDGRTPGASVPVVLASGPRR